MFKLVIVSCLIALLGIAQAQQQYTTPIPILKQIDRHNDDGSYTYGYEAADKSFKIETKYPNGEVYGKYGYVDDQGKLREIEYGASKRGFEPAGSDINVPPPTLNNNNNPYPPLGPNEVDDGQYREDPSVYYKDEKYNNRVPVQASKFSLSNTQSQQRQPQQYQPQPAPYQSAYQQQQFQPAPAYQQPYHQQQQSYYHQPRAYNQPAQPYNQYSSIPNHLHPAVKNLDIWSGSYSIDYTGR